MSKGFLKITSLIRMAFSKFYCPMVSMWNELKETGIALRLLCFDLPMETNQEKESIVIFERFNCKWFWNVTVFCLL